ncbi:hypothetical protein ACPCHT_03590 [Nucisporomicrobium flavum]|uniref:hypothetical protein n=1 Tax=Nucisporomicrobium flavum TaxID=2785915 RepID=UPI0018F2A955|nr:hypothetical protein [Nucisporomicrobium flavum]
MYDQQQTPYQQPGTTAIAVTAKYWWATFMFALFKPYLAINGRPVPAGWGRTVVPVPPGQYQVHVHVPYLIPPRVGTAETVVAVHPGQVVELEYRAPAIGFVDGAIGPAPQKHRAMPAAIALMVVPLVLLLCVCGGFGIAAVVGGSDGPDRPIARPTAVRPVPTLPRTFDPDPTVPTPGAGKPVLRSMPAKTLIGPSFTASDATYTMAFTGWPFAFRTPKTWGCLAGRVDLPQAKAWVCIDEGNPGNGQKVQIMLRPCPDPCGTVERSRLSTEWFDPGAKARPYDERTSYVETALNANGRYTLDMSHFFPGGPSGTQTWQVGIGAFTPPEKKADIHKIFNDVLTQAG